MSLATRRHHISRLRAKRKHYWSGNNDDRLLGALTSTPCPCSCWMCGNPRKNYGEKTLKEYLSDFDFNEQLIELGDSGGS